MWRTEATTLEVLKLLPLRNAKPDVFGTPCLLVVVLSLKQVYLTVWNLVDVEARHGVTATSVRCASAARRSLLYRSDAKRARSTPSALAPCSMLETETTE